MVSISIRAAWQNWSGVVTASPQRVEYPENIDQAVAIVRKAAEEKRYVRVLGSGHSCVHTYRGMPYDRYFQVMDDIELFLSPYTKELLEVKKTEVRK